MFQSLYCEGNVGLEINLEMEIFCFFIKRNARTYVCTIYISMYKICHITNQQPRDSFIRMRLDLALYK